ncbi:Bax inhibitor-1/YccA family protein [Tahibacter amnicola]|uniref:Bax inhibitor-1 family protein n=1 Tax=Tahibacter amnicola TaxID=2976241 RepID=A0ABY6BE78_9GAMM|nr:Bax inhibitor-1 family protein [Tahibacter amnicola]UXI68049.1 Bax inhibitor-1 family protein [Tahibacter amnicola]
MHQSAPSFNQVETATRAQFIKAAYTYLGGAIAAFTVLSAIFYATGVGRMMLAFMSASKFVWLGFLGAFMLVGWLATNMADNSDSNQKQTLGLGIYVVAEALIFSPLFALAGMVAPDAIGYAVFVTALLVGGLTWTAFTMKTDFTFLGGFLRVAGMVALGAIIVGAIFGFSLGLGFSALMVLFAGGCVLYDTSQIIHHYPTDRPAGAALHLFASIALMLWYVLRIFISLASSDD